MTLKINSISLRAATPSGVYGADVPLSSGLNLITAGNTSGKSTCLQAIIFGLGIERMLGPNTELPFAHVMRERIHEEKNTPYESVISSHVVLELENHRGEKLLVLREAVTDKDSRLVQTTFTDVAGVAEHRDFFLHDKGSVQREDGFHNFLAAFMGFELPPVTTFDGREVPLYLETLFPMFFVEQKRGWGVVQGPFPTFFRIQDVARRVIEFLIDLEDGQRRRKRLELSKELGAVQTMWQFRRKELLDTLGSAARLPAISQQPDKSFVEKSVITVEIFEDDGWVPVPQAVERNRALLEELEALEVPTTEDAVPAIQAELPPTRERADFLSAQIDAIRNEVATIRQDISDSNSRVLTLRLDLERNQDAKKLTKYGSTLGRSSADHLCPTCHQELDAELMPTTHAKGMAVDENIAFIRSQIALYEGTAASLQSQLSELEVVYRAVAEELQDALKRIRELTQALRKPSDTPSRTVIERIVRIQARLKRFQSMQQNADNLTDEFARLATLASHLEEELSKVKGDGLTASDKAKVQELQTQLRAYLKLFRFSSLPSEDVWISEEDLRVGPESYSF